ncbi:cathepsin B [Toxoplasma gondii ME49]|uniref:Cathepsin B n=3 Tax=Toxoplasma gondii TaxID=5811 RepID=B6KHH7_TOXGV|nr:cathepsin B [Toxoplasma gondii ME49]EPT25121.1 cathepsin B [Toxoplasma gondii ME49]ESS34395.1 cathepsin B [Toxoplasma gondii VEG]KYF50050.1 cathepsin B [Toxoplasma gondii ARI]CEL78576.1 TPA: cysteine proteinase, putative [Toxoplasma gondii VEG]|eukprot:XP_002367300.1 cathepsin B [Toxoplasma gondii ME49]
MEKMEGRKSFRVLGTPLPVAALAAILLLGCMYTRAAGTPDDSLFPLSEDTSVDPRESFSAEDVLNAFVSPESVESLFASIVAEQVVATSGNLTESAPRDRDSAPERRSDGGTLRGHPEDAGELLRLLLADSEDMELWKANFFRHLTHSMRHIVRDSVLVSEKAFPSEQADEAGRDPGDLKKALKETGEDVFWESRPASSNAAVALIKRKMEKQAGKTGEGAGHTWEPEVSLRFRYLSLKDAKKLMGTFLVNTKVEGFPTPKGMPLPAKEFENATEPVPAHFDARTAFPACKDVVGHVRDQGDCGSCWAFASTEAFNDRLCIRSQGKGLMPLSAQHTTSCCNAIHCASFGCNGGQPGMAWRWFERKGVVTGGDFDALGKGTTCWPYEVPFCAHHAKAPFPDCDATLVPRKTPKCRKDCEEQAYADNVHPFDQDTHKATSAYSLRSRDDVKRDMMTHGPVSGAFMVYEDFLSYKSGVYKHVSGLPVGGHAIKIIGWGTENGEEYWHAVNSWNTYWGDGGQFKIAMGQCGIDGEMVAGEAAWQETEGVVNGEEELPGQHASGARVGAHAEEEREM